MSGFRPTFFIPLIAFIVLAVIGGLALRGTLSGSRNPNQLPSVLIGKPAPDLPLPLLQSGQAELALSAYRGQAFLVNFFASWCPPCKIEHPNLLKLSEKVKIYGIAKKDNDKEIQKWFEKSGNPFEKIGLDLDGSVGINWGVYGLPESFLIDEKGFIIYKHVGPIMEKDLLTIYKILSSK